MVAAPSSGVPRWRTLDRDSLNERNWHDVILQADIVSPGTVGRYVLAGIGARQR